MEFMVHVSTSELFPSILLDFLGPNIEYFHLAPV